MARASTAPRRFAAASATVALAVLVAGGAGSAVASPYPAAGVAAPLLPTQGPYVIILHPQGLVTSLFDGVLRVLRSPRVPARRAVGAAPRLHTPG